MKKLKIKAQYDAFKDSGEKILEAIYEEVSSKIQADDDILEFELIIKKVKVKRGNGDYGFLINGEGEWSEYEEGDNWPS